MLYIIHTYIHIDTNIRHTSIRIHTVHKSSTYIHVHTYIHTYCTCLYYSVHTDTCQFLIFLKNQKNIGGKNWTELQEFIPAEDRSSSFFPIKANIPLKGRTNSTRYIHTYIHSSRSRLASSMHIYTQYVLTCILPFI